MNSEQIPTVANGQSHFDVNEWSARVFPVPFRQVCDAEDCNRPQIKPEGKRGTFCGRSYLAPNTLLKFNAAQGSFDR